MRTNFFSPQKVISSRDFYLLWQYLPVCMHVCLTLSSAVCAIVFTNLDIKPIRTWKQFIFQWHLCRHRDMFLQFYRRIGFEKKELIFQKSSNVIRFFMKLFVQAHEGLWLNSFVHFAVWFFFVAALKYVDKHNDVDMALKWSWIDE